MQWQERFTVLITPHPDLGPEQREMVERDYGMVGGTKELEVRYAMLFYVLKRLNLLGEPERLSARTQHIVLANAAETKAALGVADFAL